MPSHEAQPEQSSKCSMTPMLKALAFDLGILHAAQFRDVALHGRCGHLVALRVQFGESQSFRGKVPPTLGRHRVALPPPRKPHRFHTLLLRAHLFPYSRGTRSTSPGVTKRQRPQATNLPTGPCRRFSQKFLPFVLTTAASVRFFRRGHSRNHVFPAFRPALAINRAEPKKAGNTRSARAVNAKAFIDTSGATLTESRTKNCRCFTDTKPANGYRQEIRY